MRRVRMAIGLASLCAFLLTVVVPASAHQFKASRFTPLSEELPGKTRGKGIASEGLEAERNQKLVFGPFSIFCTAVTHAIRSTSSYRRCPATASVASHRSPAGARRARPAPLTS